MRRRPLNTFAYCLASQSQAVARAAGTVPLTSPPMIGIAFARRLLEHRDLVYLALHGIPGQPYLYGDGYEAALHIDVLQGLDLSSTVVFVTACHFPETPWLPALLDCNPRLLVGGSGTNYARDVTPVGAHLLGLALRQTLALGIRPEWALALAQATVRHAPQIAPANPHAIRNARAVGGRDAVRDVRNTQLIEDRLANQDAAAFRAYTHADLNPTQL